MVIAREEAVTEQSLIMKSKDEKGERRPRRDDDENAIGTDADAA
jgi:small subunit ribosomal protein S6